MAIPLAGEEAETSAAKRKKKGINI